MGNPPLRRLPLQDLHLRQLHSPHLRHPRRCQFPRLYRQHRFPRQFPLQRPHLTLWGRAFLSQIAVSTLGALMTTWHGVSLWGEQEIAHSPNATLLWPRRRHQLSNPRRRQVRSPCLRRLSNPHPHRPRLSNPHRRQLSNPHRRQLQSRRLRRGRLHVAGRVPAMEIVLQVDGAAVASLHARVAAAIGVMAILWRSQAPELD